MPDPTPVQWFRRDPGGGTLYVKQGEPEAMTPGRLAEIRERIRYGRPSGLGSYGAMTSDLYQAEDDRASLLAEVDRLTAELDFERASALRVRADVERVLDGVLGTEEEDGAGEGLAGDVALFAERSTRAVAELHAARADLAEIHGLVDRYSRSRRQAFDREALAGAVVRTVDHQRATAHGPTGEVSRG
jgi:hypothetical protein